LIIAVENDASKCVETFSDTLFNLSLAFIFLLKGWNKCYLGTKPTVIFGVH